MTTIKKAQYGTKGKKAVGAEGRSRGSVAVGGNPKLDDKPKAKYTPTKKEAKNLKDATQMKNMRPVFKSGGMAKKGC